MTLLKYADGLIGDFLGVIPVMIELSRQDELHVSIHTEAKHLFELLPKKYGIKLQEKETDLYNRVLELDTSRAFTLSHERNYYMSQSYFACLNLNVPAEPPKAELEFEQAAMPYFDYIIAPFSRSLPPQQRWPQEQWQRLTDLMPEHLFCIIGHHSDPKDFITGNNVTAIYGRSIPEVISLFKNVKRGLISVVSGPSHLAFHLNTRNYLLTNQNMTWGNNPDALAIRDYIPDLKAEQLIEKLVPF